MSIISRIKAEQALATAAPWVAGATLPSNAKQIGYYNSDHDGLLSQELRNGVSALIALYDALKAYQPRLAAGRLPLSAQRTAMVKALAALDV